MRLQTTPQMIAAALFAVVTCFGGLGCSDDDPKPSECVGDFCLLAPPAIEVQPSSRVINVAENGLEAGDSVQKTVRILNTGESVLKVLTASLQYAKPADGDDGDTPAFELVQPVFAMPADVHTNGGTEYPQAVEFTVTYTRPPDGKPRAANLVLTCNDPVEKTVTVQFNTESGAAQLTVQPDQVDFQLVPKDEKATQVLKLINTGSIALTVSGFSIKDDVRFSATGPGFDIGGLPDNPFFIDLTEAIVVAPGESAEVEVGFQSDAPTPAEGRLMIFSNDPVTGFDGLAVPLLANKSGPCILVEPREVEFGGKLIGSLHNVPVDITSCGSQPLQITNIGLRDDSSPDYGVGFALLGADFENGPTANNPLVVPVNETVTVDVTFVPDEINPVDADSIPIPDEGTLQITSDAFEQLVEVPVSGAGAQAECPIPVIKVVEGEEVIPQTVLHLDGTSSYAPFGNIEKWDWKVEQPDGNQQIFVPTTTDPAPVFNVNVVGVYTFKLDVWDETGTKSGGDGCPTAAFTVVVQPDKAIHVELTWQTPGDEDETDTGHGKGTDADLHFTHIMADGPDLDEDGEPDPWFDEKWDCFWHNDNPDWASFDPTADDNPTLDRDDTDGAGPENLNLGTPEDGMTYRIGAHFWDSHGFGNIYATTRVFFYAQEIYAMENIELQERDFWCVGNLHWTSEAEAPVVKPCKEDLAGEYIVPDYVNPFFFTP
jgi:hypothetical protein